MSSPFSYTDPTTGETWTFPSLEALTAYIAAREGKALTGVPTPGVASAEEEGWPQPAPLPEDYWETAE